MKGLKRVFGIFSTLLLIGGVSFLTSCSDGGDNNKKSYSISIADDDKSITLASGGSKTISVTTDGMMLTPTTSDESVATAEISNTAKTITITAKAIEGTESKNATITVVLNEDSSQKVEISVTVDPTIEEEYDTMTLTLNLAEGIAVPGGSVSVYYGNNNDTNETTEDDNYTTVSAELNEAGTIATATLSKEYANASGWFNGLVVTVKDADGTTLDTLIDGNNYFEFTEDGVTLAIKAKEAETMKIAFSFTDLDSIAKIKVKYGWLKSDGTSNISDEVEATVTDKQASIDASNAYINTDGWMTLTSLVAYDSDGAEVSGVTFDTLTHSSGTGSDYTGTDTISSVTYSFFKFVKDATVTYSYVASSSIETSKTFTINFEGFTIVGGSVTGLKYAVAWDNDSNAPAFSADSAVSPTVTVADDGTSASFDVELAKLDATKKEFYIDWTAVVVKDSSNTEITISSGNTEPKKWYDYTGTDWSNKLVHADESITERTFTITFSGFTLVGGSVTGLKYASSWNSTTTAPDWDNATSPTVTVATDGKSATFTVEKDKVGSDNGFYVNFGTFKVMKSESEEQTISSSSGYDNNGWYSFTAESLTATLSYVDRSSDSSKNITGTFTSTTTDAEGNIAGIVINASEFSEYTITSMKVSAKLSGTNNSSWWISAYSKDKWLTLEYTNSPTIEGYCYEGTAEETFISLVKENGLSVKTLSGLTADLTVAITYTAASN